MCLFCVGAMMFLPSCCVCCVVALLFCCCSVVSSCCFTVAFDVLDVLLLF